MPSPFLALSGIEYAIGPKSILRGIDLTLEQGRIYGLVGPNGSGKSTLLKIIARQVAAKSGAIAFGGWLPPVGGAVFQEVIDLAAVLNALRAAVPGGELSDY